MTKFTPGPWVLGKWEDHLGYDCMTGGVRAGPVVLDGGDYGQKSCTPISVEARAKMEADARLIAAAPELYAALDAAMNFIASHVADPDITQEMADNYAKLTALKPGEMLAKVRGEQ